ASLAPLVLEARNWSHGVLVGAGMASETTAAATGQVGVVRREPMAMKPFCGYHFGDYWAHCLEVGNKLSRPPKIFQVNWFRRDEDGRFIWPGFSDNMRVLEWIIARCRGEADAVETPVGHLPDIASLNLEGLDERPDMERLLAVDPAEWREELKAVGAHLDAFGDRVPEALVNELEVSRSALEARPAGAGGRRVSTTGC